MNSNPILQKLGFDNDARVVIFHADDIGMNQASVTAYAALLNGSPLTSAAVMVPCPWFPEAAGLIRAQASNPALDVGVHLTLTSEWGSMRWGPISTTAVSTHLFDDEGYFPRQSEPVQQYGDVDAIGVEIEAQIGRALDAGIVPTHIDSHMGTLFHPRLLPQYIQSAMRHQLPFLGLRLDEAQYRARGYDVETAVFLAQSTQQLEAQGFPLFDSIQMMPLHEKHTYDERLDHAEHLINALPPGLHYFIIHPSEDSPELRALTVNWPARVGDLRLFLDDKWGRAISQSGIETIGFGRLKTLLHHASLS